jgi:hypothetical protein
VRWFRANISWQVAIALWVSVVQVIIVTLAPVAATRAMPLGGDLASICLPNASAQQPAGGGGQRLPVTGHGQLCCFLHCAGQIAAAPPLPSSAMAPLPPRQIALPGGSLRRAEDVVPPRRHPTGLGSRAPPRAIS